MGRKKAPEKKRLRHLVCTRLDEAKYQELKNILSYPPYNNRHMSDLVRRIVENRRIKIFTRDTSFDPVLGELKGIRGKIGLTGTVINQYTKAFHSHLEVTPKVYYAKMAFTQFASLEGKIDRLLVIVQELAKKWLDENSENSANLPTKPDTMDNSQ